MNFTYGELVLIYSALEKLKGNNLELISKNKTGLIDYEPVKITNLMTKVKSYGESYEK